MQVSSAARFAVLVTLWSTAAAGALAAPPVSTPALAPQEPAAADFRLVDPENMLVVDTNKGRIIVEMSPLAAPNHVVRIKTLAHQHFYDGLTFFRVVEDFMDQTGDPTNTGSGDSPLPNVPAEFTFRRDAATPFVPIATPDASVVGFVGVLPVMSKSDEMMVMTADGKVPAWPLFCAGVMGMARNGDPDSANSQFFFMRAAYPSLEKKYTGWGRVVVGEDVVRSVKVGEPAPDPQDKMLRVRLGSDIPQAERPKVFVLDTKTQAFKALVARTRIDKGADFSACDIEIPAQVR